MALLKLNSENFDSVLKNNSKVLVDFYADWCGPCRILGPTIEQLANELDHAVVAKVNVDESPELASRYGVVSIPTVLAFKNGEAANKSVGVQPKEKLAAMLD